MSRWRGHLILFTINGDVVNQSTRFIKMQHCTCAQPPMSRREWNSYKTWTLTQTELQSLHGRCWGDWVHLVIWCCLKKTKSYFAGMRKRGGTLLERWSPILLGSGSQAKVTLCWFWLAKNNFFLDQRHVINYKL